MEIEASYGDRGKLWR